VTILRAAAAVLAAALLTACTTTTAGHPAPAEHKPATTSKDYKEPYSLARLCELLEPEEAQQLGGSTEGEEGHSIRDGHDLCKWADETDLLVGWQANTSTANVQTGPGITNTPTTIDGLPAVRNLSTDPITICQYLVDLPSGKLFAASVAVLTRGEGKYDPCEVASRLTNLIVPRVRNQ